GIGHDQHLAQIVDPDRFAGGGARCAQVGHLPVNDREGVGQSRGGGPVAGHVAAAVQAGGVAGGPAHGAQVLHRATGREQEGVDLSGRGGGIAGDVSPRIDGGGSGRTAAEAAQVGEDIARGGGGSSAGSRRGGGQGEPGPKRERH